MSRQLCYRHCIADLPTQAWLLKFLFAIVAISVVLSILLRPRGMLIHPQTALEHQQELEPKAMTSLQGAWSSNRC